MRRCRPLLGTFVEVDCDGPAAIDAAFEAVALIHRLMSAHEPGSDLCRVNRLAHLEPVEVSAPTIHVLERSVYWWRVSSGLFDVAAAGCRALDCALIPRHPDQPVPEAADSSALSLSGNFVQLSAPACLDLGGIAKGYAVDRAIAAMRVAGATRGLVNAGGDLFGLGPEPWTVEVLDPLTRSAAVQVKVDNEALATSALVDGSAAHLPGATRWNSVTVRAANACDADALTKILWAGGARLLGAAGAAAFGIADDGTVEDIGEMVLAA